MSISFRSFLVLFLLALSVATTMAQSSSDTASSSGIAGSIERTHFGSYGEFEYKRVRGDVPRLDIPRLEIDLDHQFSDKWAMYSETEIEHVKLSGSGGGEISLEEAFIDFHPNTHIGWRAGLLVLPIGFMNQTHEPTTYYSVERPLFDQQVIPTTWREIGTGVYGTITNGLNYQVLLTEGIKASGFSFQTLEGIKQEGASATGGSDATHPAVSAKLDWIPFARLQLGISDYYQANAGPSREAPLRNHSFNLTAVDGRYETGGLRLKGEFGLVSIGSADVSLTKDSAGNSAIYGVNGQILQTVVGGYFEAGFNLLSLITPVASSEFVVFVRCERYTFKSGSFPVGLSYEGASGVREEIHTYLTGGLAFKPLDNIILKADYRLDAENDGQANQFSLGAGYDF